MSEWKGKGFFFIYYQCHISLFPCLPLWLMVMAIPRPTFSPERFWSEKVFVLLPPELDLHGHGWCVSEIRCGTQTQLVTTAAPMPRLICLNRATEKKKNNKKKHSHICTYVCSCPALCCSTLCFVRVRLYACVCECVHVVRLQITSEPHSDDANQMVACVEIFESVCVYVCMYWLSCCCCWCIHHEIEPKRNQRAT